MWLNPNIGVKSLGKEMEQVAGNLSISHAWKGIFIDSLGRQL